jgi:uncharacterized protein YjiS (DUF1127 family)
MIGGTDMTTHSIAALWSRARTPFRLFSALRRFAIMARTRRDLARLDEHLLRDIGLTRHEAETEAFRAPWDVPPHWRG